MAATKVVSKLAAKYGKGLDAAVKAHASDDTTYGIIALPAPINNGIAQLSKCYFKEVGAESQWKKSDGTSAKGEFFFRAEGTVDSPDSIPTPDGIVPVRGLTTSVMIPLFDQKNAGGDVTTQEMQVTKILNIMRQLAGPEYTKNATGMDLESLAAGLEEAKPYFRFSTSLSKPKDATQTPRVFENWHGNKGLEDYQGREVVAFNESPSNTTQTQTAPTKQEKVTSPQEPEKRVDAIVPIEEWSLEDLVSMAEAEGADQSLDARQRLIDLGIEAGYAKEELESETVGWGDIKTMIETPKTEGENNEARIPEKGTTCNYSPPNKKTPGKKLDERSCQITAVDEDKQTVDLKDLTTKPPAVYKGVEWSELS